ncbi:MAG: YebC/PmpR family DNA-binding transcriptional regulator, partial [Cyclobacteriaceae bacterium]|nr:YebC/PmpR family DNA-binding transcriptional regulator [Cyclobacteriaceae bacterium]
SIAAREGGGDPDGNPRLRLAVANAKGNNMPKDNIGRAIKKATGSDAEQYHETTYEGYATHGVAVFVECLTDNSNRTVSSVRSAFTKHGGSLGTNGSLEFIFDRKGVFSIKMTEDMDEDEFSLEMIDAGAEDETLHDGYLTISCDISDFGGIQKKLEELGVDAENAELQRIPNTLVTLGDDDFGKVMKLIDALEDNDDVQKVFHNLDITEAQMELL